MRAPALIGIVVALHIAAIGAFVFIQGCESVRDRSQSTVAPPTAPVMPPPVIPSGQSTRPILQPPVVPPPGPGAIEGATHVVSKGEILSKIAVQYGLSTAELAEYNNLTDPNKLRIGDKLIIPPYAKQAVIARPAATPAATMPVVASRTGETIYVVQSGDNLTRIARKFGVKISDLRAANQLQGDMIKVNQKLTVPATSASAPVVTPPRASANAMALVDPEEVRIEEIDINVVEIETSAVPPDGGMDQGNALEYIVVEEDTLEKISRLFIVSQQDLIEFNELGDGQELEVGDIIKIPPSAL